MYSQHGNQNEEGPIGLNVIRGTKRQCAHALCHTSEPWLVCKADADSGVSLAFELAKLAVHLSANTAGLTSGVFCCSQAVQALPQSIFIALLWVVLSALLASNLSK